VSRNFFLPQRPAAEANDESTNEIDVSSIFFSPINANVNFISFSSPGFKLF